MSSTEVKGAKQIQLEQMAEWKAEGLITDASQLAGVDEVLKAGDSAIMLMNCEILIAYLIIQL